MKAMKAMKAGLLISGTGALVYLTSYDSFANLDLINKWKAKGIKKFISYEIPIETVKQRYGEHFKAVLADQKETDDLRILDYSGDRAFNLFSFHELGPPFRYEEARSDVISV